MVEARVFMCAQSYKEEVFSGTLKECESFYDLYHGEIVDENQLVWDLTVEEV